MMFKCFTAAGGLDRDALVGTRLKAERSPGVFTSSCCADANNQVSVAVVGNMTARE